MGSTADGTEPARVDARQSWAPLAPMRGESQLQAWQGWWEQPKCTQLAQQLAARGTGREILIFRIGNHSVPGFPFYFWCSSLQAGLVHSFPRGTSL